ncbi:MAG: ImmA/IrrE family metallo-endopeptidase, partial [Ferruginibacter sp.]
VFVFDIAQTDGPPLPEPVHPALLTGQAPPQLWEALAAQVEAGGFTLVDRAFPGGQNGETNFTTRTVAIHPDRDPAQRCKTLAHELAHTLMHHPEDPSLARLGCRDTIEVEAESVAYLVAHAHSLDSGSYTFPYLASWTTGHPDVVATLRATAGRVLSTAHHILDRLDQQAALHDTEPWDLPRAIGPRHGVDHEQQASPKPAAVRAVSVGR